MPLFSYLFLPIVLFLKGSINAAIHVLTGPDHLAAVAPMTLEAKGRKWNVGVFWGLGHLIGLLFIGGLYLLFHDLLPIEKISSVSEILVAIVIIALGVKALFSYFFSIPIAVSSADEAQ